MACVKCTSVIRLERRGGSVPMRGERRDETCLESS